MWLVKTSTGDSMEWQKTFGGSYDETGYYVEMKKQKGGYMIVGSTESLDRVFLIFGLLAPIILEMRFTARHLVEVWMKRH